MQSKKFPIHSTKINQNIYKKTRVLSIQLSSYYRRLHKIKHILTDLLHDKNFDCFEEVHAIDEAGSSRFADIVAFKKHDKKAYILDPTVRYENNDIDQAKQVDQEKKTIYNSCIPFFQQKYTSRYGNRNYIVQGLLFGARGTIYQFVADFLQQLGINKSHLETIAENVISDSVGIIHHHIYGNTH